MHVHVIVALPMTNGLPPSSISQPLSKLEKFASKNSAQILTQCTTREVSPPFGDKNRGSVVHANFFPLFSGKRIIINKGERKTNTGVLGVEFHVIMPASIFGHGQDFD